MFRINKFAAICLAAALTFGSAASLAATVSYTFSGVVDSGALLGETYAGQFAYDDASLSGAGDEFLTVSGLSFNFLGNAFDQADSAAPPEAVFIDGTFLGLAFNVDSFSPAFSTIAGFSDVAESYFAYDDGAGNAGFGSIAYSVSAVPEPETWSLLLSGLVIVGYFARRRRIAQ